MFLASKAVQLLATIRGHNAVVQSMNDCGVALAPDSQVQASLGNAQVAMGSGGMRVKDCEV